MHIPIASNRWFLSQARSEMRILIAAAMLSTLAFTPASAAMMKCTSDNMAKRAADKEMGMANTDMSNGKTRSACAHYAKAQQSAAAK
jgi:hypothetical protein